MKTLQKKKHTLLLEVARTGQLSVDQAAARTARKRPPAGPPKTEKRVCFQA